MVVIMTVLLLSILAGVIVSSVGNTYENSRAIQFSSYMQIIQKKVDLYVEEGTDYKTLGQTLSAETQTRLQSILDSDPQNKIETTDATSESIRYFNSQDIDNYFNVSDINDEVVVNFANREIISLNGIEQNGSIIYVP